MILLSVTSLVPILCILMIALPVAVTVILLLPASKDKSHVSRFAAALILMLAACAMAAAILLRKRFSLAGIPLIVKRILIRDYIYQDIRFLCLAAFIVIIIAIAGSLVLRRIFRTGDSHISYAQEYVIVGSMVIAGAILAFSYIYSDIAMSHVILRELHADGSPYEVDDETETSDYVVLENTFDIPLDLEEMYLSDSPDHLDKYPLKGTVIAPGETRFVCLDSSAPFRVSGGETVYLSDARQKVYGKLSYAAEEMKHVDEPVLSAASGFYDNEFDLTISVPDDKDDELTVYYTIDGSRPTTASAKYSHPIRVRDRMNDEWPCNMAKNVMLDYDEYEPEPDRSGRAFVVRAAAFDRDGNRSRIVNGTYLIGQDHYADHKVISLTADYDELFGEDGICVTGREYDKWYKGGQEGEEPDANFLQSGRAWEIEGNLEFFDKGQYMGGQDIGLRVFGGSSRRQPIKKFSMYARRSYSGSDRFLLDFFNDPIPVHSVCLRGIGNTDAVLQEMAKDLDVTTQSHTYVSVFLNGESWCDTFLCEKYSPAYFYEHYGIPENDLVVIKEGNVKYGNESDLDLYTQVFEFVTQNDMTKPENYAAVCDMIDIQSYIDYMIVNTYCCNLDQDEFKNRMLYRVRTPIGDGVLDGKWRWMLYDMDAIEFISFGPDTYGADDLAVINPFTAPAVTVSTTVNDQMLFRALRQNEEFRRQFVESYRRIATSNYSVENVSAVMERNGTDITAYDSFFEKRAEYMNRYVIEEFGTGQ